MGPARKDSCITASTMSSGTPITPDILANIGGANAVPPGIQEGSEAHLQHSLSFLERLGIAVRGLLPGGASPPAAAFSEGDRVRIDDADGGSQQGTAGWVVETPTDQNVKVQIETSHGTKVFVVDAKHLCKGEEVSAEEAQKLFDDVFRGVTLAGPAANATQNSDGSLSISLRP